MHLDWGPEDDAFRAELLAFLDEHAPPQTRTRRDFAMGVGASGDELIPQWARDWQATLFDHGWMIPGYPPELGGRNATPIQTLVYLEEMAARGVPRSLHFPGYAIVAPSLLEFGTPEQQALAPAAIRGDTIWCIGMSEPNAGSDLAGLQTRAVLDGDRFVVNGQKVWTSYAMVAEKCFLYVRTDPDAPKHKGISLLIVDMDTPGIDDPPAHATSPATPTSPRCSSPTSRCPPTELVGELNDGWRITQGSLAHERAGLWVEGVARLEQTITGLVDLAHRRGVARGPDRPASHRRGLPARRESARARVQGVHELRPGLVRARALVHEDGELRARQAAVRAGHGDPGCRTGPSSTRNAARSTAAGR